MLDEFFGYYGFDDELEEEETEDDGGYLDHQVLDYVERTGSYSTLL